MAAPSSKTGQGSARIHFGRRLRHWRRKAGLTQAELGRCVCYDHSYISRVESASRWPSRQFASRCDELLDTDQELSRIWQLVEHERLRCVRGRTETQPEPLALPSLVRLLTTDRGGAAGNGRSRLLTRWLAVSLCQAEAARWHRT